MLLTAVLAAVVAPAAWGETVTVSTDTNIGDVYQPGTTTKIEVTGGTLSFGETTGVSLSEGLHITGATVTAGEDGGNGFVSASTDVYINADGVLRLTLKDSLGWDTTATKSITLKGTDGHKAVMELAARQTQTTDITMAGNAEIKYAASPVFDDTSDDRPALASWNGDFSVSGTNNTISANLDIRKSMTIQIAENSSLEITGKITNGPGFSDSLTISGAGSVSFGSKAFLNEFNRTAATVKVLTEVSGEVCNKNSYIEFGDGITKVNSTVDRLELCDLSGASAGVKLNTGYTLKITEGEKLSNNNIWSTSGFIIGEWGAESNGTLEVAGALISANCSALMGDGGGTINVTDGGFVAVKGIKVKEQNTKLNLTVAATGKLVLGEEGIASTGATDSGKYTSSIAGTIGIMANSVSIERDLTIAGDAVFDTTQYAISDYTVAQNADSPTGGTLKLTGNLLGTGTVSLQGVGKVQLGAISSAVDIHAQTDVDFLGSLTLADGKRLTLGNGVTFSVSTDDLSSFDVGGSYVSETGVVSGNGNGFKSGTMFLVAGGTIEGSATLSHNGQTYTIDNDNRTFGTARTDYDIYYLNENSATVSVVAGYADEQAASVSEYVVAAGTTLNIDTVPAAVRVNGNATLNISNNVELNHSAVTIASGAKATMTGNGTYSIVGANAALKPSADTASSPLNILFDNEKWTGQVNLLAANTVSSNELLEVQWLNLNHYGNANSTIKLRGVTGYFCSANSDDGSKDVTFTGNLLLENSYKAALELSNGCSGDHFIFSGKIDGTGNMIKAHSVQQDFTFTGDVSTWTGNFDFVKASPLNKADYENKNRKFSTLTFKDAATDIGVNIRSRDESGSVNHLVKAVVRFENDENVEMKGSITHNNTYEGSELKLEVATAKGTTFKKEVNVTATTLEDASKAMFEKGLTTSALHLGESSLVVTTSVLSESQTLGAGAAVIVTNNASSLTNITATSAKFQAGGSAAGLGVALTMSNGSALEIIGDGGVALGGSLTLGRNITVGDSLMGAVRALNQGNSLVLFTGVTDLTFSGVADPAMSMLDAGVSALSYIDAAEVFAGLDANIYTIGIEHGNVSINMLSIPEPTTPALSLLALAGLAARRRRK